MAIQRWTIAKIGGAAANPVCERFKRWQAIDKVVEESDNEKWSESEFAAMKRFVEALRAHSLEPPVIFFSEHVDMWSVGNSLFRFLSESEDTLLISANFSDLSMARIKLPSQSNLTEVLQAFLHDDKLSQEDYWFLNVLINAIQSWEPLVPESVIIVIRQAFTASVHDEQIMAACSTPPNWLFAE